MNRKQFAETVAQAYQDQYHHQEWRRSMVMNHPVIDYSTESETFSSCSSLTPAGDDIRVWELSDGMFGSDWNPTKRGIIQYIMAGDFDYTWRGIVAEISDEVEARS